MKHLIRSQLVDCSDREKFRFSLTCKECGTEWKSTPIRFSKAGEPPLTESKRIISEALYQREHMQAMEHAVTEAVHHFNSCPLCARLVCNYCFIICDDLDMCLACAERLHEVGETVLERSS